MKPTQTHRLLYLLALVKLILPFLLQNPAWEPHRDEFLYLAEARHMAWGFMEVPPLLSVFAWLTNLLGGGMVAIKIWPALFGAFTYILVGKTILSLGGRWFALVLGFLPFVFGAFLRMQFLFQPNFLDIFFWSAMAYALVRFKQTDLPKYLYFTGVSLGLGMLSKYSMAFYATGLLAGMVFTTNVWRNRHFYYAIGLGFLICLPNLVWQLLHGIPLVYHMSELQRNQLQYISPVSFLMGQVLLQLPCIYLWVRGLIWAGFAKGGKPYRFLAWAFGITILLLVLGHGKDYYSQGAYPILFAFGAAGLEERLVGRLHAMRYVVLVFTIFFGFYFVTFSLPFLPPARLAAYYARTELARITGTLHWEDQQDHNLPQDFADMLSWKEMTEKTAKAYASLDSAERKQTLLFADNYGEAGAVNYYGPAYHLPECYSDNASFLYWMPPGYDAFQVFLLVTDDHEEMHHAFIRQFRSALLVDSITNPYARERGSYIILLKGPSEAFRQEFRDKIDRDKRKTTAVGAAALLAPNALENGGSLH